MEFSHNVPGAATAAAKLENHERHEKHEKNRPQMDKDEQMTFRVFRGPSTEHTEYTEDKSFLRSQPQTNTDESRRSLPICITNVRNLCVP